MKKSFMTRALATGLSLAMAFSLTAATNVTTAAAASAPAMKSKTMTVKVDQSKNYAATAATQKAYKITKIKMSADGKTKAKVTINSSKKSIKVTGLKATKGKNVVITFKNNKTGKKTTVTTKVVVKAVDTATKIASVKQKTATSFEVTLSKAVTSASTADFSVVRDASNAIVAINTAKVDEKDGTKVTLTTYESLTDGKDYTFTYTAADEAKTQSTFKLTATDGTIDSLNLTPLTITAGKATTIKYQTIDKNGVVLSEKSIGSPATGIEVKTTYNDGYYTSTGALYLTNVNDSATIVVSYHTYKYDGPNGEDLGLIEKTFTVKAIDSAAAATYEYTIATSEPSNWATVTKNTKIAMGDTAYKAYIRIKDTNGDSLSDTQKAEYSVESSNNNVLLAAGTVDGAIALTPVAQGSAYLIVSKDGKNVTSLPVTVVPKRIMTSVKVANSTVTIATNTAIGKIDNAELGQATVNVSAYDQYGVAMAISANEIEMTSAPLGGAKTDLNLTYRLGATGEGSVKVEKGTTDPIVGTYNYKITLKDASGKASSALFSVRTVAGSESNVSTLKLVAVETDDAGAGVGTTSVVDTTFNGKNKDDKDLYIYLVGVGSNNAVVSGSPLSSSVSVAAITVTGSDGTVYAASGAGITNVATSKAITASDLADALTTNAAKNGKLKITLRDGLSSKAIRKYLPAGVYTVTYTLTDKNVYTTQFTVKDEQPATTVKVVEPSIGTKSLTAAFASADHAVFSYDGIALTSNGASKLAGGDIKAVIGASNGTKATVQYVVAAIPVTVNNTTYKVDTVVPVNVVFTGSNLSVNAKSYLKLY